MDIKCFEEPNTYLFIVENTFEYRWSKEIPEGKTLDDYLQTCKRESLLLGANEIIQSQQPQEIVV